MMASLLFLKTKSALKLEYCRYFSGLVCFLRLCHNKNDLMTTPCKRFKDTALKKPYKNFFKVTPCPLL